MEHYLLSNPWLPITLWLVLYTGDYYLTLWGARLYKAQSFTTIEGSYELTPLYQKDVDGQKMISWRFILNLIYGVASILILALTDPPMHLYGFLVGMLLITELVVWMRHVGNITLYRRMISADPGVSGHLEMSRESVYRRSAVEWACISVLLLLIYVLTFSPLLIGGAVSVGAYANRHRVIARKCRKAALSKPAEPVSSGKNI